MRMSGPKPKVDTHLVIHSLLTAHGAEHFAVYCKDVEAAFTNVLRFLQRFPDCRRSPFRAARVVAPNDASVEFLVYPELTHLAVFDVFSGELVREPTMQ